MRITIILAVLIGVLAACAAIAAQTQSEEDAQWKKLEAMNNARELYLMGEAANKKGDYRTAIWCWMAALEFKPDSAQTKKCLAQAREKLYKNYNDYERKNGSGDRFTCCVVLEEIMPLLPGKTDIPGRLEKSKASLNPAQIKGLATYKEAVVLVQKGQYDRAGELAASLQALPFRAACIDQLNRTLHGRVSHVATTVAKLPKLIYLGNDG